MDPKATLYRAGEELMDGSPEEAREYLESYLGWRSRGGFEPVLLVGYGFGPLDGDDYARALSAKMGARFPGYQGVGR